MPGGFAYVPSADKILQPFVKSCRGLKSATIQFETTIYEDTSAVEKVAETLFVNQGGQFRRERSFPEGINLLLQDKGKVFTMGIRADANNAGEQRLNTLFPIIFFHRSPVELLNDLNSLGVETCKVGIDRIGRKITFFIGKGPGDSPGSRLWIDRERNLPLRFVGVGMSGGETVILRVEYLDYRKTEQGFLFPGTIEYYRNDTLYAVSVLQNISLIDKLPEPLFGLPESASNIFPVTTLLNIKE